MVGKTTARNSTQQPLGEIKLARVVNANTGLFTATVRTRVTAATMTLDAVGADATYALAVKRSGVFFPIGNFTGVGGVSRLIGSLMLDVGDLLTNVGDNGSTNGTTDMSANVEEL